MSIEEFYGLIKGDYQDIISRFGSDIMIKKFVKRFLDEGSYASLCDAMNKQDYNQAFLACHTLKGVCLNMAFSDLCKPVLELTEELRGGNKPTHPELLDQIQEKYNYLIDQIKLYVD